MQLIPISDISVPDIIFALKQGKTIVYPTETCYGLGCDATNEKAIDKVFKIKQRQRNKSVLVIVSEPALIMNYVRWDETLQELAEKYWPGALTVVVSVNGDIKLSGGVVDEDGTLAFRITDHPLASELSRKLDRPLISTSANIAAQESPYDIQSVLGMFENVEMQPDIIIDAGELPHKSPSTVVRIVDGNIEVLRQGEVIVQL